MDYRVVLGTLSLMAGTGAMAAPDVPDPRWYVSPMVGYLHTDPDRDAKNGPTGYLGLGKPVTRNVNLEFNVQGTNVDHDTAGQYEFRGAGASALGFVSRNPRFSPYLVVGAVALRTKRDGTGTGTSNGAHTNPAAEVGAGFFSRVLRDTSLRVDVRRRTVFDNDTIPDSSPFARGKSRNGESRFDDWIASVGVAIPLGAAPSAPPEPAPVVAAAEPAPPPPQTIKETVILEGVNFCFDCDQLSPQAKQLLDTNARKVIDANMSNNIELAGHTDSIGTDEYNQDLSQRRVNSVRTYLIEQGVDGARLTAQGYGESQPIADNSTPAGRAKNRRVEVRVME